MTGVPASTDKVVDKEYFYPDRAEGSAGDGERSTQLCESGGVGN